MPKASSTETRPEVFPFLKLPPEIRDMIYRLAIGPKNPIYVYVRRFQSGVNTGLLYANRQVYEEACPVLYANTRGIICNESHLLSRACCCDDFLANPRMSMRAYDESPPEDIVRIYEERSLCKKPWGYRNPAFRNIHPSALARMGEIDISLTWLMPGYWDLAQQTSLTEIVSEVSRLLRDLCATLNRIGNQRGKNVIFSFGTDRVSDLRLNFSVIKEHEIMEQLRELSGIRKVQVHGNVPHSLSSALEGAFERRSFPMANN